MTAFALVIARRVTRPQLFAEKLPRTQSDMDAIQTALVHYRSRNGFYPSTEQGLDALVSMTSGDPQPRHWVQELELVPRDPWGTPYCYEYPGKVHPRGFDLYSAGPDRKPGTADDVWNSRDSEYDVGTSRDSE